MATWQYRMALVPNIWLNKPGNNVLSLLNKDGTSDTYFCWEEFQPTNIEALCNKVLPKSSEHYVDARVWGKSDSHDIYVSYDNGKINEIRIRLDLYHITLDLIKNVTTLVQSLDCCLFLIEEKEIIKPDFLILCKKIKESNAYKFVKDPHDFLRNLDKKFT